MTGTLNESVSVLLEHLDSPASFYRRIEDIFREHSEKKPLIFYRPASPEDLPYHDLQSVVSVSLRGESAPSEEIEVSALLGRRRGLANQDHSLDHYKRGDRWFGALEFPGEPDVWFAENRGLLLDCFEQMIEYSAQRHLAEVGEWISELSELLERHDSYQSMIEGLLNFTSGKLNADELGFYAVSDNHYTLEASLGFKEENMTERSFFPRDSFRELKIENRDFILEPNKETGRANLFLPLDSGLKQEGVLVAFNFLPLNRDPGRKEQVRIRNLIRLAPLVLGTTRSLYRDPSEYIVDELTPLKTGQYLLDRLEQEIERGKRYGEPSAFLLLEVENLDDIRETHGETVQRETLRKLAQIIRNNYRMVDVASRFENNQLGVLFPHTDPEGALKAAHRFDQLFENPVLSSEEIDVEVKINGGLASYPVDGENADKIIKQARLELYEAKQVDDVYLRTSQESEEEEK